MYNPGVASSKGCFKMIMVSELMPSQILQFQLHSTFAYPIFALQFLSYIHFPIGFL